MNSHPSTLPWILAPIASGFLCEAHAVEGAAEITAHGGWENYLKSRK